MTGVPTLMEIEVAIARYFNPRQNIIVPNISWGLMNHECDMLVVTKSGFATEIEIKRSRADLLADFRKAHHHEEHRIRELYYCIPECLYEKCVDLIPEEAGVLVVKTINGKHYIRVSRPAQRRKCRALTPVEMFKLARLGTLRIFPLKATLIRRLKEIQTTKENQKSKQ